MMRIRSIKPEFWKSEDIAKYGYFTRLLFVGLWSYVDDNGVGRDNENLVYADLFPLSRDPRETIEKVSEGLRLLHEGGQINRYSVDGKPFLSIAKWSEHQRIDKPAKERYPVLTCANAITREYLATVSRESSISPCLEQRNRGTEEQGNRGNTYLNSSSHLSNARADSRNIADFPTSRVVDG